MAMIQTIKSVCDLNSWRSNANSIRDDEEAAAAATATDLSDLNRTHVLHKSRGGCQTGFRLKFYFDGPPLQSPIVQSSVSSSNGVKICRFKVDGECITERENKSGHDNT